MGVPAYLVLLLLCADIENDLSKIKKQKLKQTVAKIENTRNSDGLVMALVSLLYESSV